MLQVRSMVRTVPRKCRRRKKRKLAVFCNCMCWKQDLVLDKRFTVASVHRHTTDLLQVSQMAARVADCCRLVTMGIRRVALASTSNNVDCHNEVFVQIGFECMVVPVNNDLNNSVENLHWRWGSTCCAVLAIFA